MPYVIYVLSCNVCNAQYICETTLPFHKSINLHRRAKSGCEYVIKCFKDVYVGASFSVEIIEVFPGTGYTTRNVQLIVRLG